MRGASRGDALGDVPTLAPGNDPILVLAYLGCQSQDSQTRASLDAAAWQALRELAFAIDGQMTGAGPVALGSVHRAANAVTTCMVSAYGEDTAGWWAVPAPSPLEWRSADGLDVPVWWGLRVAARYFESRSRGRHGRVARLAVNASEAAWAFAWLMEDWCGYWRAGSRREWSNVVEYKKRRRRYLDAAEKVGGMPPLLIKAAPWGMLKPQHPKMTGPRLVHSQDA